MPCVTFSLPRRGRVVRTQALCVVAQSGKVVGQNPSRDQHIHTGIEQILFLQTVPSQHRQPSRIDLHQPDITRAVAVVVDLVAQAITFAVACRCWVLMSLPAVMRKGAIEWPRAATYSFSGGLTWCLRWEEAAEDLALLGPRSASVTLSLSNAITSHC